MEMGAPPPSSHPGILHYIPPNLCAFEQTIPLGKPARINTLLWVGGMYDTLLSTAYPSSIAKALGPTWSLMSCSLGSAGLSWGVGSIARDAEDMGKIVAYVKERRPGGKVIIMGHSTGCQDCMEYTVGKDADKRPRVDGVILQAPVSDREALEHHVPKAQLRSLNELAEKMRREGEEKEFMPHSLVKSIFGRMSITAGRWLDVASPDHAGADDYFSSDLSDKRLSTTFGKIPASSPLLILFSGSDEAVNPAIDKARMVERWMRAVEDNGGSLDRSNGGIVEGASHSLNGQPEEIVQGLVRRVIGFLSRLEKGELGGMGGGSRI